MSSANVRRSFASFAAFASIAAATACASAPAPPSASPAPSPSAASPAAPARAVSAVVLVNGCAHLGAEDARLAQAAINQLVDGCRALTEDRVQFTATLLPGGAIQFEPRPGASQSIPVCVLNHPLTHKVRLQKACSLDVRLEESSMSVPRSGDAGP